MSQASRMVDALKHVLRARGITYEELAGHLHLSESSVKRLFSKGGFTLERLEAIARYANIELVEIARQAEADRLKVQALTHEQEAEIVADPKLMLAAIAALNRWDFNDILTVYQFSEPELIQALVRLDRLGLIELMPGNRIRLLIERDFAWLPQGPIQRFFMRQFQDQFLAGDFSGPGEVYEFRWGMITQEHAVAFAEKLNDLLKSFSDQTQSDELRPRGRARGMCLLTAFKEWEPEEFNSMRNQPETS